MTLYRCLSWRSVSYIAGGDKRIINEYSLMARPENIQLTSCTYTSNSSYTEGSNSNSCFISTESFNVNTITNAELNVTPGIAKDSNHNFKC